MAADSKAEITRLKRKNEELRARLRMYKKATAFCTKCQPNGGAVNCCQRCALMELHSVISRIDYFLGEPNELAISLYDVDYDDERVIGRVMALAVKYDRLHEVCDKYIKTNAEQHAELVRRAALLAEAGLSER